MSLFQIISIAVFIIIAVVAVLMFSGILPGYGGGLDAGKQFEITLWGTFPADLMERFLDEFQKENKNFSIEYAQKQPENFETELINVLASGEGPDLWLLPQDLILKHKNKIQPISFETLAESDFKNIFIDEGELYLDYGKQNIIALPFIIDPLVMFYNKNLFRNVGLTQPPETWAQFITASQILTVKDESGNIKQSGAALGEYSNIFYAKDILSALIFQTGNPIISQKDLKVVLGERADVLNSAETALRFYTEFSNPRKISYSWNKFLDSSKEFFIKGRLAMYFSYASELKEIQEKNPNLDFSVSQFPQVLDGEIKATFGKIWGIAISNQAKNKQGAFLAAKSLVAKNSLETLSQLSGLPAVRRDLLGQKISDPYLSVFYKAAVWSWAWLDPEPEATSMIFKDMIESVNRRERDANQAISDAKRQLEVLVE